MVTFFVITLKFWFLCLSDDLNLFKYIKHHIFLLLLLSFMTMIITKWTLSLTQPHKTGSWGWGLHPLIYNELSSSLVNVGSPSHTPHAESDRKKLVRGITYYGWWSDKPNKYSLRWNRNGSNTMLRNGL